MTRKESVRALLPKDHLSYSNIHVLVIHYFGKFVGFRYRRSCTYTRRI